MGCLKLTYCQEPELKVSYLQKELTLKNSAKKARRNYVYGFQGQERDDKIKGKGNSYSYKYRMDDPRVGRFLSIDPLADKYPFYSPYSFSGDRVLDAVELEGKEPGLNPMNYLNAHLFSHFDHGRIYKQVAKTAVNEVENTAKDVGAFISNNRDVIGDVVTGAGYVMYLTPETAGFAPAVVQAGEAMSTISVGVDLYNDVKNGDKADATIQVSVVLLTRVTGKGIDRAFAKKLINKNEKVFLKFVNTTYGTALHNMKFSDKDNQKTTSNDKKTGSCLFSNKCLKPQKTNSPGKLENSSGSNTQNNTIQQKMEKIREKTSNDSGSKKSNGQ